VLHTGGLSKMQIPETEKKSLGIVQSYIVFQMFVFSSKLFNIEIGISDTSKVFNLLNIKKFQFNHFWLFMFY